MPALQIHRVASVESLATKCDLQHSPARLSRTTFLVGGFSLDPKTRGVLMALIVIAIIFAAGLSFH